MGVAAETVAVLAAKFQAIFPHLDERQRRLLIGAEARSLGHGGIRAVARAAGMREATVSLGVGELESGSEPLGRARRPGGGRKRLVDLDPGLRPALLALVEPDERGDPMSPLRWTTKSTRKLADELTRQGHKVSADVVAGLLRAEGFSLQGNAKTIEGSQLPDRDGQFRYINERVKDHQASGDPVISVDTKKREHLGNYAKGGREWRPKGRPVQVRDHDFPDPDDETAIPYGIYDMAANTGWVNVGTDHDTAAFAVESIRRWWKGAGHSAYPKARRLLITADAGGSNGYRTRAWKAELAALAVETGLEITVCHFPPGTSKWNRIEHRLFSHITLNWRGRPLTSHDVIVNTIAATTTRTGLKVHAELDPGSYPTGVKISVEQMKALPITRHPWHADWNYTLRPEPPAPTRVLGPQGGRGAERTEWAHPALTGIEPSDWAKLIDLLTISYPAQRDTDLYLHHGRPPVRTSQRGHASSVLTVSEKALATILRRRFAVPVRVLAALFGVTHPTVSAAERQLVPLLERHGHLVVPTGPRLRTLAELTAFAAQAGITLTPKHKPAR